MTKAINTKQLCILIIFSMCALKFLFLPSMLSVAIKQDLYLSCIIIFSIEFLYVIAFTNFMKLYPDKTFFEVAKEVIGEVFAKIFYFLLAAYFTIKTTFCMIEVQTFFGDNLFDYSSWFVFFIPFLILIIYIAKKGLRNLGRLAQLFFNFVVITILFALLLPVIGIDFSNILPIFDNGVIPVFRTSIEHNFWFGDYLILFILCGRVKLDKKWRLKVILSFIGSFILILIFMIVFYSTFNYTSGLYRLAISDLASYIPNVPSIGRVDWIIVVFWSSALILQSAFGLYLSYYSFSKIVPQKNGNLALFNVVSVITFILIGSHFNFETITNIFYDMKFFSLSIQLLSPILLCYCMGMYGKMVDKWRKYVQKDFN